MSSPLTLTVLSGPNSDIVTVAFIRDSSDALLRVVERCRKSRVYRSGFPSTLRRALSGIGPCGSRSTGA